MSHRTAALPELSGMARVVRELRYHESSRQLVGIALVALMSVAGHPVQWSYWAGMLAVVAGAAVRMWAAGIIFKNRVLATTGPYAYVRHPLYVGNVLLLAGFAIASSLWWSAPLVCAFLLFYYPPAVEYEDRKLHQIFGEAWSDWSVEVRALWPRRRPYASKQRAQWSFAQSLRRNGEPLILLYLGGCAVWLYLKLGA
jgi:protein-S-isoprenylcysteine O-methyltransferase Ste14